MIAPLQKADVTVSIESARMRGSRRYFTGRACLHGHVCERFVSTRSCVICQGNRKKEWAAQNKQHVANYAATYLQTHRDQIYKNNRANQLKHPERTKIARQNEYLRNKVRYNAAAKLYRTENKEQIRSADQLKRQINPAQYAAYKRNYKHRKQQAGKHTGKEVSAILKAQHGKCAYCRMETSKRYHVDHIMPLALGGSNDRTNLQILCAPCNQAKSAKHPITFAQSLGMLL